MTDDFREKPATGEGVIRDGYEGLPALVGDEKGLGVGGGGWVGSPVGAGWTLQCIPPCLGLTHDYYISCLGRLRDISGRSGSLGEVRNEAIYEGNGW